MAEHRPIVIINGNLQQLPVGDTILGSPVIGSALSYSNPGGFGDRTGEITTTTSIGHVGDITSCVDGLLGQNLNDSWYFASSVSNVGKEIKFQFTVEAKKINEIRWIQSNTSTHGTWKIQGSNDNTTWSNLSFDFVLGGSTSQFIDLNLWDTITPYTYFRLFGVSGTCSSSAWIQEIEFKIEA